MNCYDQWCPDDGSVVNITVLELHEENTTFIDGSRDICIIGSVKILYLFKNKKQNAKMSLPKCKSSGVYLVLSQQ